MEKLKPIRSLSASVANFGEVNRYEMFSPKFANVLVVGGVWRAARLTGASRDRYRAYGKHQAGPRSG